MTATPSGHRYASGPVWSTARSTQSPPIRSRSHQVSHVGVGDRRRHLHLESNDPIVALDDEVDLVATRFGSQMENSGARALRIGSRRERCQRLEEPTEESAVTGK